MEYISLKLAMKNLKLITQQNNRTSENVKSIKLSVLCEANCRSAVRSVPLRVCNTNIYFRVRIGLPRDCVLKKTNFFSASPTPSPYTYMSFAPPPNLNISISHPQPDHLIAPPYPIALRPVSVLSAPLLRDLSSIFTRALE